jgi:aminopeptidase
MDERLERYAELVVGLGANVQPGQEVFILPNIAHQDLARALTRASYKAGASYVNVLYRDAHTQKAMIELGSDEALSYSPEWLKAFFKSMDGNAMIATTGDPEPELLGDLDGERVARAIPLEIVQIRMQQVGENAVAWTGVGAPTEAWAQQVFGEPDVEKLWEKVAFCMRLDEPDPVAAWREHIENLERRAAALNERKFDALRYRGPGTDLSVGLLTESVWQAALDESIGIKHVANMPTEEVFTAPDARRVEGTVRSTYPLQIHGTVVRGLEVRFEGGRAVEVRAEDGQELMQAQVAADDGAARLGEVALVDGSSRVGKTGLIFYDTLFDENAASHIAFGAAIPQSVDGAAGLTSEERHARGINQSSLHTDFMIGSREVAVAGVTNGGEEVPILQNGDWVLQ